MDGGDAGGRGDGAARGGAFEATGVASAGGGLAEDDATHHRPLWSQEHRMAELPSPPSPPSPSPSPPSPAVPLPGMPPDAPGAPPGHTLPGQRAGGLPFEADECLDRSGPTFCAAFRRMGRCSRSLGMAMGRCRRSCGICVTTEGGAGGAAGGSSVGGAAADDEDVSGYGHRATRAELEHLHEAERGDWMLTVAALVLAAVGCGCMAAVRLAGKRKKVEKLEAKCAV